MWDSMASDSCDACQCSTSSRARRVAAPYLDKENLSPGKEDLSLYGRSTPPPPQCTGTSPNHCPHSNRRPLEDYDPNSRDSGYLTNDGKPVCGSLGDRSTSSMDDDFFEDFADIEALDENNLPCDFNKLITEPISSFTPTMVVASPKEERMGGGRPLFRRALSLQNERTTQVRACLFKSSEARAFKRPEPPVECESPSSKKQRLERPLLQRHLSATEESIMCAVQRSTTEPDLIGDFSKKFCLPLTQGRHRDLKSITSSTLARLIRGDFNTNVATYKVIDCRYPYEYEGGHIEGALNVYTKDQCLQLLSNFDNTQEDGDRRKNILIFHCEFSSERGPNLYRYLREQDRQMNIQTYPTLHYPEIYLLEGGYKKFFEQYSGLCVPIAYKEMLHPEHKNDLRYFRQKSKTWNEDSRQRNNQLRSFKRL